MNAFEAGSRKVIPAVLVYLRAGGKVLMIHRATKAEDFHAGRWNGLGGKLEPRESPAEAARRELREEAGLDLKSERFSPRGSIYFPDFKPHKHEDWMVFIFTAQVLDRELSSIKSECDEGKLHWIEDKEVSKLNLWPGDHEFLPQVLAEGSVQGTIWYRDQKVERVEMDLLVAANHGRRL